MFETTISAACILEILAEFLARVLTIDLAFAEQTMELTVGEPCEFHGFAKGEDSLPVE